MRLQAKAVLRRTHNEDLVFYFVRQGRLFQTSKSGFLSDRPVTLFMRGLSGRITSKQNATLTLTHPKLSGVRLNGEAAEVERIAPGRARLTVPSGTHMLELIPGQDR